MRRPHLVALAAVLATLTATPLTAAAAPSPGPVSLLELPDAAQDFSLVPPLAPVTGASLGADGGGNTLLMGALYGGAAGALIGLGVALIENDHWFRDIAIGGGAGIIVGAAFGAASAMRDTTPMRDGLGTLDRSPVIHAPSLGVLGGRF